MSRTPRPTADLVLLMLAASTSFVILITAVSVILEQLLHPESSIAEAAQALGALINTVVGALIGYLAGARRKEQDPEQKDPEQPEK